MPNVSLINERADTLTGHRSWQAFDARDVNGDPQGYLPPTGGTTNGLPVLNWDQAAAQLTRGGYSWSANLATPITLTYAFRTSLPAATLAEFPAGTSGFSVYNAIQITLVEQILRLYSDIANITFMRVGTGTTGPAAYSDNAALLFGNFTTGPNTFSAFAFLPAPGATAPGHLEGDVWTNGSRDYMADPATFSRGAAILVHEIGHALGLLHASDYGGGAQSGPTYLNDADYWQDTAMFTQMSYFNETFTGANFAGASPTGLQLHDIAAIQRLYGANVTTRAGDTIYGFNSNTDRPIYTIATAGQRTVFAIWDGGGQDTLDFSGYTQAADIDLREQSFSSTGGLTHNISIARGAVIERAIGGSGNDTITGNAAANVLSGRAGNDTIVGGVGNDVLNGQAGNDTLTGGADADVFYFLRSDLLVSATDTVTDYAANDLIYVADLGYTNISVANISGAPRISLQIGAATSTINVNMGGSTSPIIVASGTQGWVNAESVTAATVAREFTHFDWANTQNYVQFTDFYDASARLYREIGTYDGTQGSWDFLWDVDNSNAVWSQRFDYFNAAGQLIEQNGTYDGAGGSWIQRNDPTSAGAPYGTQGYVYTITYYDTLGRPTQVQSLYDDNPSNPNDGGHGITTFDPSDSADFEQYTTYYTASGAPDSINGVYDDDYALAATWWVNFDETDAQAWDYLTVLYDDVGTVVQQWFTMDDGSIVYV